jgi:hypothetical protein
VSNFPEYVWRDRALAAEAKVARLRAALDEIASWSEGPVVNGGFDEPGSAQTARAVLAEEKE